MTPQTSKIIEARKSGIEIKAIAQRYGLTRKHVAIILMRARESGILEPLETREQKAAKIEKALLAGYAAKSVRWLCSVGYEIVKEVRNRLIAEGKLAPGKIGVHGKRRHQTDTPQRPQSQIAALPVITTDGRAARALEACQAVDGCRYPIGETTDLDFHFCCAPKMPSDQSHPVPPYCRTHDQLCHTHATGSLKRAEYVTRWLR